MSSLANWTYVYLLTIWAVSVDDMGQPIFAAPYTVLGDWEEGGEGATDTNGTQFVPTSTYYFEAADGSPLIPKPDDYILRGDHTALASPPNDAEKIKKVGGWGMDAFGAELPDWRILT
jgi:hypothetical protein